MTSSASIVAHLVQVHTEAQRERQQGEEGQEKDKMMLEGGSIEKLSIEGQGYSVVKERCHVKGSNSFKRGWEGGKEGRKAVAAAVAVAVAVAVAR